MPPQPDNSDFFEFQNYLNKLRLKLCQAQVQLKLSFQSLVKVKKMQLISNLDANSMRLDINVYAT